MIDATTRLKSKPIIETMTLASYLQSRRCGKADASHLGFGGSWNGCYKVADDAEFINLVKAENARGVFPAILEVKREVFPLIIDIDLKANGAFSQDQSLDKGRLFSFERGVRKFIKKIDASYRKFFDYKGATNYYIQMRKSHYATEQKEDDGSMSPIVKDGLHIVCPQFRTTGENHRRIRHLGLSEEWVKPLQTESIANDADDIWDESVLKANNWFAIGCSKEGLPPYELDSLLTNNDDGEAWNRRSNDSLKFNDISRKVCSLRLPTEEPDLKPSAQHISEFLELKVEKDKKKPKPKPRAEPLSGARGEEPQQHIAKQGETPLADIKALCDKLPVKFFDKYEAWFKFICCLKNLNPSDECLALCVAQCRRTKKYDNADAETATRNKWAEIVCDAESPTLGSLKHWVNPKKAIADEEKAKAQAQANSEYAIWKTEFEKKACLLLNPPCYYVRVDDGDDPNHEGQWTFREPAKFRLMFGHIKLPCGEPALPFWQNDKDILCYSRTGFYPQPELCPPRVLNDFHGFAFDKEECEAVEEPLLLELLRLICESDEAYEYVLSWLAWGIQFPHLRKGVYLLFQGGQGTGKDTWASWFGRWVLGGSLYLNTSGERLFTRFNAPLRNRLLIHVEEASGRDFSKNSEQFKTFLTAETIEVECKGIDPITENRHDSIWQTSQSINPVVIESDDRRAFAQSVQSHPHKQDYAWFKTWREKCCRPEVAKWFGKFLRDRDLTGFSLVQSRPQTRAMAIGKSLSVPVQFNFLEHIVFDRLSAVDYSTEKDEEEVIGSQKLWERFIEWGAKFGNGQGIIKSNKKLTMTYETSEIGGLRRGRGGGGIEWTIEVNKLRKWLCDNNLISDPIHRDIVYPPNAPLCAVNDDE